MNSRYEVYEDGRQIEKVDNNLRICTKSDFERVNGLHIYDKIMEAKGQVDNLACIDGSKFTLSNSIDDDSSKAM